MLARKVGWEVLGWTERGEHTNLYRGIEGGVETIDVLGGKAGFLSPRLRADIITMLRFRPGSDRELFGKKAASYLVRPLDWNKSGVD